MALPCGRCALRLASGSTYEGFMAAREVRGRVDCPACLGILDHESYIDQVVAGVQAGQYEFEDYRLTVAVPPSLIIRQHWLQHQAKAPLCADVKDVLKWGLSYDLARRLNRPFSPASPFLIQLSFLSPHADQDLYQFKSLIPGLIIDERKTKRTTPDEFSLRAITESMKQVSSEAWSQAFSLYEPRACAFELKVELSMHHIYLAGSYMKYSRRLSQSPWFIEGEDKPMGSVQEILGEPLKALFGCESYSLHGSGREDVDVRMLGKGRPFVMSLFQPKKRVSAPNMEEVQRVLNEQSDLVKVRDIHYGSEEFFAQLNSEEEDKLKAYCAVVWTNRSLSQADMTLLNAISDLNICQKTPVRVLHRRSLLVRERKVLHMNCELLSEHLFRLNLVTTAGTYVKEFVHGDFGRTTPNVGQLLSCHADILQLDVLGLDTDREELRELICSYKDVS